MKVILMKCAYCGKEFEASAYEVKRWIGRGRDRFFCGLSCTAKFGNDARGNRRKKICKTCLVCGREFETFTGRHEGMFCSRSCASKGSVTNKRREKAREMGKKNVGSMLDIEVKAKGLRTRESWKYAVVEEFLKNKEEAYKFEFPLEEWVFDLALLKRKVLIEFDGNYHQDACQRKIDFSKDAAAAKNGWFVIRVKTKESEVISSDIVVGVINAFSYKE